MLTEDDWPISRALILYATLIGAAYYYRNVPWFYNMFKDTFLTKGLGLVVIFCMLVLAYVATVHDWVYSASLLCMVCFLSLDESDGPPPPSTYPDPAGTTYTPVSTQDEEPVPEQPGFRRRPPVSTKEAAKPEEKEPLTAATSEEPDDARADDAK